MFYCIVLYIWIFIQCFSRHNQRKCFHSVPGKKVRLKERERERERERGAETRWAKRRREAIQSDWTMCESGKCRGDWLVKRQLELGNCFSCCVSVICNSCMGDRGSMWGGTRGACAMFSLVSVCYKMLFMVRRRLLAWIPQCRDPDLKYLCALA